jgi:ribosome modulation factor
MKSTYWMDGWHAWVKGRSFLICPHFDGHAREEWMQGYHDARCALTNRQQ